MSSVVITISAGNWSIDISATLQNSVAVAPGRTACTRMPFEDNSWCSDCENAAHLSPRQFSRIFRSETGQSPAKAIEHLRVEAARFMIESGRHSLDVVARETGFADRERMRRSFLRAFGQPPQAIRRTSGNMQAA